MSANVPGSNLLTVQETAELLRQSERSIRRKIHSGQISAVRLGDQAAPLRIRADRLEQWLAEHEAASGVSVDGPAAAGSFAGTDPAERRGTQAIRGQSNPQAHAGQERES
jgi:excisionase family DNA binding protein